MGQHGQIREAADFICQCGLQPPRVGIVLGTGLGRFAAQLRCQTAIDYERIPHFPRATALGHAGRLIGGTLAGMPVAALEGRLHAYEGYSQWQIALPIRVMKELGIQVLILSNASGGVHPRLNGGDLVVIEDHINLMWGNPLTGPRHPSWRPRLPDMATPYDRSLSELALRIARQRGFAATRGVYAAVTGPNYETRAEYRFLRRLVPISSACPLCPKWSSPLNWDCACWPFLPSPTSVARIS